MNSNRVYSTGLNSTVANSTAVADVRSSRRIAQFENHPAMLALLKELPPRAVAALFREIGVTDTAVLMAMMPTRELLLAFDESIWKSTRPDLPETIGVRDLIDWLIAWNDVGEEFLVEKLAAMSEDYLTTVLSRIVKVESASRYAVYWEDRESLVGLCEDDRERIGPYIVQPTVEADGDVVAEVVRALWSYDAQKLLSVFGRLSDIPDPMDSPRGCTPTLHDVEFERASYRQAQGFVAADGARAFFAYAERLTPSEILALDAYDPETRRYLDIIARASVSPDSSASPVVGEDVDDDQSVVESGAVDEVVDQATTEGLRALLEDSRLLPRQSSVPLLQDSRRSKELLLTAELRRMASENLEGFHARARELAYLANVLRRVPTNDVDPLDDDAAKGAAFAICNLGLELAMGSRPSDLEKEPGLIRTFLLGRHALVEIRGRVVGAFAGALSQSSTLAPWLQSEATAGLSDLRRAVEDERFEEAREAIIFLSIAFDARICRAVAPLLSAIPRFSMQLDGGDSEQTRWINSKSDVQLLDRLLHSLRLKSVERRQRNQGAR